MCLLRFATRPCNPSPILSPKIDVMVVYSEKAWSAHNSTETQLLSSIAEAFQTSNTALLLSGIYDFEFDLVHVDQVSARVEHARPHGRSCFVVVFLHGRSGVPVFVRIWSVQERLELPIVPKGWAVFFERISCANNNARTVMVLDYIHVRRFLLRS